MHMRLYYVPVNNFSFMSERIPDALPTEPLPGFIQARLRKIQGLFKDF